MRLELVPKWVQLVIAREDQVLCHALDIFGDPGLLIDLVLRANLLTRWDGTESTGKLGAEPTNWISAWTGLAWSL